MENINTLTLQDLSNLKMCCLMVAKIDKTTEVEMKALLLLSDKLDRVFEQTKAREEFLKQGLPKKEVPPTDTTSPDTAS